MPFFLIFIIVCTLIGIYVFDAQKQNEKQENLKKEYNAIYSTEIKHICGLPLAEGSNCILHLCENEIIIENSGNIFRLQKEKILDMNIKTSKEIQNSISNAVGGYMLLGPIGAFLGGSSTELHRFFIIIYKNKDNKDICISFDMENDTNKLKGIYRYIENEKSIIKEKKQIEI